MGIFKLGITCVRLHQNLVVPLLKLFIIFPNIFFKKFLNMLVEFSDCSVEYFFGLGSVAFEMRQIFGRHALDEDHIIPFEVVLLDKNLT
jgi:hypothetical protein